ncbi:putative methyltransferase C1B3.06c-like protein [Cladobotryum mycophilum]|uniref:Methyltransferase C1B3.06c-like protein n=1 Tax=Cladobotryum mycophilum TaxID=491253 RepID=A0ABR0SPW7_9HYPO
MDKYVLANIPEFEEKLAQRNIVNSVPHLIPVLDQLPDKFILLDVGCGPGSITCDIAKRHPSATILGIDASPEAVEKARQYAKDIGVTNTLFTVGDGLDIAAVATQPGFEAVLGGCDVVNTHQVHIHVQDAQKLMRELYAAAKPQGGVVCCREGHMGMLGHWPASQGMAEIFVAIAKLMQARGQDPFVATKLFSHALAAGFKLENITTGMGSWVYATPKERREWVDLTIGSMKHVFMSNKQAASMLSVDISQVVEEAEAWVQAEDGWFGVPCPQVICRRQD